MVSGNNHILVPVAYGGVQAQELWVAERAST